MRLLGRRCSGSGIAVVVVVISGIRLSSGLSLSQRQLDQRATEPLQIRRITPHCPDGQIALPAPPPARTAAIRLITRCILERF
jgi:hypothetical protein